MGTPHSFGFWHNGVRKFFGPYMTVYDAAEAFKDFFGYWPDTTTVVYHPSTNFTTLLNEAS